MTLGTVFTGIGGIDLGFERAGFDVRWQCEVDPWCRSILTKQWPGVPVYDDVRTILDHDPERVDVLAGGFPCQDISVAGRGAGLDGTRSTLWWAMYAAVRALRPRYAVLENSPALAVRGLDRVLGALAEIGYDAEWTCLSAAAFGAPHLRDRLFIVAWDVAHADRDGREGPGVFPRPEDEGAAVVARGGGEDVADPDGGGWGANGHPPPGQPHAAVSRAHVADPDGQRREEHRPGPFAGGAGLVAGCAASGRRQWAVEPGVGRVADGIPRRVDRVRGLGNAVVPQVATYVALCVLAHAERATEGAGR